MCLITFALQSHPKYELILVANRDEFFKRPTIPMHFWENTPRILAGKDLIGKGTWLGIDKHGKFSALTNYRDGFREDTNAPSRGNLTSQFLENNESAKDYIQNIEKIKQDYNGFNLLVSDESGYYYLSNYYAEIQKLEKGIYSLSNSILNDFSWKKAKKAKNKLSELIEKPEFTTNELIRLMFDTKLVEDAKLSDTGVPYEWEKGLSAMFITNFAEYGTRCTTAILRDYDGNTIVQEMGYDAKQHVISDLKYTFKTIQK